MPYPRYFKLWYDDSDPEAIVCDEEDLKGVDRWFVYEETPISWWPADVPTFYYSKTEGEHAEDYLGCALHGWELFSERVREAIEELGVEDIEFLPVRVLCKETGEELSGYSVLHVQKVLPALDREHAGWDEDPDTPGEVLGVYKYALRADVIGQADIFRLKEASTTIFFSPRVKGAIEKLGATGFKFRPVEVY